MSVRWPRVLTPTLLSQILKKQKNPVTALKLFDEAKERIPNYGHNGSVYATMISILGKSNRMLGMKYLIKRMKEDSCECKDTGFPSAICTFSKAGKLDDAISLFKSLHEFNCVNWTLSFETLLEEMVKESELEAACYISRVIVSYKNNILNTYVGSSRVGKRFKLAERNSTLTTELRAGTATFLTMAYILAVNASILSDSSGTCSVSDCVPLCSNATIPVYRTGSPNDPTRCDMQIRPG